MKNNMTQSEFKEEIIKIALDSYNQGMKDGLSALGEGIEAGRKATGATAIQYSDLAVAIEQAIAIANER